MNEQFLFISSAELELYVFIYLGSVIFIIISRPNKTWFAWHSPESPLCIQGINSNSLQVESLTRTVSSLMKLLHVFLYILSDIVCTCVCHILIMFYVLFFFIWCPSVYEMIFIWINQRHIRYNVCTTFIYVIWYNVRTALEQ